MKPPRQPWDQLVTAARRAPDERDASAPYGFATRLAARAFSVPPPTAQALLEKFALRGLFVSGLLGLAAAAYGYTAIATEDESALLVTDIVTEVLAQS